MSRKKARIKLFELVFELCFSNFSVSYDEFLKNNEFDEINLNFIKDIYVGIVNEFEDINTVIKNNLVNYTYDRIFKVDLAILLIATYEIIHDITPISVIANEAVDLAKKYSTEKSYSFINGVISNINKTKK